MFSANFQKQRFLRSLRDFGRHRHRAKCASTDRHKKAQTGAGSVTTDTDRHKIARDVFY